MTLTEQINSAKLARSENGLLALFIENKEIGFFDVDHQYYGEEIFDRILERTLNV